MRSEIQDNFRKATSKYGLSATRAWGLWAVCGEDQRAAIAAACDTDEACRAVADAINGLSLDAAVVDDEAADDSTDAPAAI